MSYKNSDPKGSVGALKIPLHLVPPSAIHGLAEALADGAKKYGPYNWRESKVSAMTYVSALKRHVDAWLDGENFAHDSLVHHLKHAAASIAIMLDAEACGTLIDDRPPLGVASFLQADYARKKFHAAQSVAKHPTNAETLRDEYERDDQGTGV